MNTLKALWQRLVTREKLLFKSATIWLGAIVTALPDILAALPSAAQYLPSAWQDTAMRWIGIAILLCRLRSMVKLPKAAPLPDPTPEATR
jgi:hypothetical protein